MDLRPPCQVQGGRPPPQMRIWRQSHFWRRFDFFGEYFIHFLSTRCGSSFLCWSSVVLRCSAVTEMEALANGLSVSSCSELERRTANCVEGEHAREVHRRRKELADVAVDDAAIADGCSLVVDLPEAVAARGRRRRHAGVGEEARAGHHVHQVRPALRRLLRWWRRRLRLVARE